MKDRNEEEHKEERLDMLGQVMSRKGTGRRLGRKKG